MKHRFRTLFAVPLAALGLSAGLAACGTTESTVLNVDGVKVSQSTLDTELQGFAANQLAQQKTADEKTAMEGRLYGKTMTAKDSFNADFVAFMLNTRMVNEVVHAEAVARKVTLTPLDASARTLLVADYGGEALFTKLPKEFQSRAERSAQEFAALLEAEKKKLPTPAEYFETNKAQFPSETCISHILVPTEPEASAARARIVGGEDFAAVAKALSQDPGSKDAGGSLSCGDPAQFVAEFATAANALPIDELSQPVQTQFGFHVIKVTKRTVATVATAKSQIDEALSSQAQTATSDALVKRLKAAKVTVAPTVGAYVAAGSNGFPEIVSVTAAKAAKASADAAAAAAKAESAASVPAGATTVPSNVPSTVAGG